MSIVLLLLRYVHVLSAIAMMGAAIFMRFALVPAIQILPDDQQKNLHDAIRGRWSIFVRGTTLLLLVSGIANLVLIPKNFEFSDAPMHYHMAAGIKLLLALPIFFISELLMGRSETAKRAQANRGLWLSIALFFALATVLLGGWMRTWNRTPKQAAVESTRVESATVLWVG